MNNYNFYKYYTLYFVFYGIGISLLIAVVTYTLSLQQIQENLDAKAEEIYNIKIATILKPTIENMDDLVRALGENRVIEKFLQTNDAHAESELEEIFLALATSQKQIMQVRLLDASGQEIIRIDRTTQEALPQIVPHQQLQNKKKREITFKQFPILQKVRFGTQNSILISNTEKLKYLINQLFV